jgi:methylated-DNA-protein-cysteine methyltransferase-like protein
VVPGENRIEADALRDRASEPDRLYEMIYGIIGRIPEGRVATYGQIAALAGRPGHARQVGYALSVLSDSTRVPWHRVINSKGQVSTRTLSLGERERHQQHLLEEEGVVFDQQGRVDLDQFLWNPRLKIRWSDSEDRRVEREGIEVRS